jgi:predicted SnoaL-like aldol condensation-catalyzing enzyme
MSLRKDNAMAFLQLAATGRVREAYDRYVDTGFRHHNPYFEGTAEALMKGMDENARKNPDKRLEVLHALEDGDLVAVHSHVKHKPADVGVIVFHLFRFAGSRIAELWDVGQEIPGESVNANGML